MATDATELEAPVQRTRTLRRDGYRILTAGGAAEAFELLAENEVHVIVSDQRMPRLCGTEFLGEANSVYPDTVRMVLHRSLIGDRGRQPPPSDGAVRPWARQSRPSR